MKYIRKISLCFTLLLFCALCSLLTSGCARKKTFLVGFSQCAVEPWHVQMNQELLREANLHPNMQVEIRSTNYNSASQIADIEYFIRKKVDLLIVVPNESEALTPIIERAYDANIPVVLVERGILSEKYTARVAVDNYAIGHRAAEYIYYLLGGKGRVIEMTGLKGSAPAFERHAGFSDFIRSSEIELVASVPGTWMREDAHQAFDSLLQRYPGVDAIFCHNDAMAIGAADALPDYVIDKRPILIGVDAMMGRNLGLEQIASGNITASFINPTVGDVIMKTAINILKGRSFEREVRLSSTLVDGANVSEIQTQSKQLSALTSQIDGISDRLSDSNDRVVNQKAWLVASMLALLLLVVMVIFLIRANSQKTRLNAALERQKERLQDQAHQLEQQRDQLEGQKNQLEAQRDRMMELAEKAEEATRAKLAFFTNVSHDFHTPISLIADPLAQLRKDKENLTDKQVRYLDIMQKNVNILHGLMHQILEFRKVESGTMQLQLSHFDLAVSLREWMESFQEISAIRKRQFSFDIAPAEEGYLMVADAWKVGRIVYNLLSNAFKYTPEQGSITVSLSRQYDAPTSVDDCACIEVKDTGVGISKEHLSHIFDTFYRVDELVPGVGIGLSLVKGFVELHHGRIEVESKEGEGTIFRVFLPMCQEGYEADAAQIDQAEAQSSISDESLRGTVPLLDLEDERPASEGAMRDMTDADKLLDETRDTILVIDDNADIRDYLKMILGSEYRVVEAADGEEGLHQAQRIVPTLVICDVMMPVMDGLECCRRLKEGVQTSHIPVILLTAYSLDEQKIQGFESGADAYLTKPFSGDVLKAQVQNLIRQRKLLLNLKGDAAAEVEKSGMGRMDKNFTTRVYKYIQEHLSDSNLDVENLSSEMGLSRVQLYRKVKALTGYAPNELVRNSRLAYARDLFAQSDMSVSEIAYESGFTSPSYFAKCFRDYFGESPTEYAKSVRQTVSEA